MRLRGDESMTLKKERREYEKLKVNQGRWDTNREHKQWDSKTEWRNWVSERVKWKRRQIAHAAWSLTCSSDWWPWGTLKEIYRYWAWV